MSNELKLPLPCQLFSTSTPRLFGQFPLPATFHTISAFMVAQFPLPAGCLIARSSTHSPCHLAHLLHSPVSLLACSPVPLLLPQCSPAHSLCLPARPLASLLDVFACLLAHSPSLPHRSPTSLSLSPLTLPASLAHFTFPVAHSLSLPHLSPASLSLLLLTLLASSLARFTLLLRAHSPHLAARPLLFPCRHSLPALPLVHFTFPVACSLSLAACPFHLHCPPLTLLL